MGCIPVKEMKEEVRVPDTPETNNAAMVLQTVLVRDVDPITIRPIRFPFFLQRSGVMIRMDPEALFEYVSKTGDLNDPVCKQRYAKHELMRMQRVVGKRFPDNLDIKFSEQNDTSMLTDFLIDEISSALSLPLDEMEAVMTEAIDNLTRLIQSSGDRDVAVSRLRDVGVQTPALAPLILMVTHDEI